MTTDVRQLIALSGSRTVQPRGPRPALIGDRARAETKGVLIAFAGEQGAFAHEACLRFHPGCVPLAKVNFAAAANAVQYGESDFAMLPLENSIAGPVPDVADFIETSGLAVVERHRLPVRLHLLSLFGVHLAEIRMLSSHPVALAQCGRWIERMGAEVFEEDNTAAAARRLSESADMDRAVIASAAAARLYGLNILAHDIQDDEENVTIFGLVERKCEPPS